MHCQKIKTHPLRIFTALLGFLFALSLAGPLLAQDIELRVDLSNSQFCKAAWVCWDINCGGDGWDDFPFERHDGRTLSRDCSGVDFDVRVNLKAEGDLAMHWRDLVGESLGRDFVRDVVPGTASDTNLIFDTLPAGSYVLQSFHNDPDPVENNGNPWPNIPAIEVEGDAVTTSVGAEDVPQHTFEFDDDVLASPSVVTFETDGSGPVEVVYAFPAVLNGFILTGVECPAEKPDPAPGPGPFPKGDTDCVSIEVEQQSGQEGFAGTYRATVNATDGSVDSPIIYRFLASRLGIPRIITEASVDGVADFELTGGTWTIKADVGDLTDFCFVPSDDFCSQRFDVQCPEVGDTTIDCGATTVTGPEDEGPGVYAITITAEDEGDDEILYIVNAVSSTGLEKNVTQVGNNVVELNLTPAEWTVTITADDDDFCEDAKDNVCVKDFEVFCIDPDFPDDLLKVDIGDQNQEARGELEEGWKPFRNSTRNAGLEIDNIDCITVSLQVGTIPGNSGYRGDPPAGPFIGARVLPDYVESQIGQSAEAKRAPESDINATLEGLPEGEFQYTAYLECRVPANNPDFQFPFHTVLVTGDVRDVTDSYFEEGIRRDETLTFPGICLPAPADTLPQDFDIETDETLERTVATFATPAEPGGTPGPVFVKLTVNPDAVDDPEAIVPPLDAPNNGSIELNGFTIEALSLGPRETAFRRGLINEDEFADISDSIAIFGFLFTGEPATVPCDKALDTNDDGGLDVSDGIFLLAFLFLPQGEIPAAPFTDCGTDLTADALTCESFPLCEAGG